METYFYASQGRSFKTGTAPVESRISLNFYNPHQARELLAKEHSAAKPQRDIGNRLNPRLMHKDPLDENRSAICYRP
jgi:hypothetical protein